MTDTTLYGLGEHLPPFTVITTLLAKALPPEHPYSPTILGTKGEYIVILRPIMLKDVGLPHYVLCSSRIPNKARSFKTVTSAFNEINRIGYRGCEVITKPKSTSCENMPLLQSTHCA